ncbi:MAG TPA: hypothetical protein VFD29_08010 [Gillisia sp.]|nr:hypothetical protein [Gillisia sp.]
MKKILILFSMFLFVFSLQAQESNDKQQHRERIKAIKVAYITQELNMDAKLAEKFWPIYNQYECAKSDLHKKEHFESENIENITEAEAEKMLTEFLNIEKEEYTVKKELYTNLKKIMSAREIIKLHKLESDFNRKLIKEYHARKAAERNKK